MRRWLVLLAPLCLGACTVVGAPGPASPPAATPPPVERSEAAPRPERSPTGPVRTFDEVRGLWVVRSAMTSEREVRDMVRTASTNGFNTIVVQVRGRADAFYRSQVEPRGETLTGTAPGFDPLELAIEEGHARGMAVHAWINTHLVWGPAALPGSSDHMVNAHPEWLAVPKTLGRELYDMDPGDPRFVTALSDYARAHPATVEGLYSSPSHPEVVERVHAIWMDLLDRYDLDGLHFDYIRYPSPDFDYSRGALEGFRAWVSARMSAERLRAAGTDIAGDPFELVAALPDEWGAFRRDQVTGLVARIYGDVKARRPEVIVSAAVIANADEAFSLRFQDWRGWLERGILDVAVPMAYTTDDLRFQGLVREARRAAGSRTRVWAGIGAYLDTVDGTLAKIDLARAEDAGGLVLFSYDWAVSEGQGGQSEPLLEQVARRRFGGR